MLAPDLLPWILLNAFFLAMLLLDLVVFHRRPQEPHFREALGWTGVWVGLALLFNVGVFYFRGTEAGLQFLAAYLVEESLSVDNLFVFLLVFSHFAVPAALQRGVLFWGILGALVMRLVFILAGVALLERFHWLIYGFGAILVVSGVKLWSSHAQDVQPERNPLLRLFRRLMPVTEGYEGTRFFVRRAGRLMATPLALVLLVIESTDLVFAVDSIPAVLAISKDPFIVYSSNAFAVLGLRALFFTLAGLMKMFHHLHYGLSAVLVFVGLKMLASDWIEIPVALSLGVIVVILTAAIVASLRTPVAGRKAPGPEA